MPTFDLKTRIENRKATIGIVGLGYVGLPLVLTFGRKGFATVGFDIDSEKVRKLESGESYIRHIPAEEITKLIRRPAESSRRCADYLLRYCRTTVLNGQSKPAIERSWQLGRIRQEDPEDTAAGDSGCRATAGRLEKPGKAHAKTG